MLSDADEAYPVIVQNITSTVESQEAFVLSGKDTYKFKNSCTAFSPTFNGALVVTRAGTVKMINCRTGVKTWHVAEVVESLDVSDKSWQFSSVEFSRDGRRAIALDRRGKLIMVDFT